MIFINFEQVYDSHQVGIVEGFKEKNDSVENVKILKYMYDKTIMNDYNVRLGGQLTDEVNKFQYIGLIVQETRGILNYVASRMDESR